MNFNLHYDFVVVVDREHSSLAEIFTDRPSCVITCKLIHAFLLLLIKLISLLLVVIVVGVFNPKAI